MESCLIFDFQSFLGCPSDVSGNVLFPPRACRTCYEILFDFRLSVLSRLSFGRQVTSVAMFFSPDVPVARAMKSCKIFDFQSFPGCLSDVR